MATNKLFFSIVIPCLNEEELLPLLLDKLGTQTFIKFETIVVDANSEDNTVKSAEKYKNKLKLQIINTKIRNVAFQRNLGAKLARGQYIIFMDADVQIGPRFLKTVYEEIRISKPDFIKPLLDLTKYSQKERLLSLLTNYLIVLSNNSKKPFTLEAVLIVKRNSFMKLDGFNKALHNNEGRDLFFRAVTKNMKIILVKKIKYYVSYRRAHRFGYFPFIVKAMFIEFLHLLNVAVSWKFADRLYPMGGGKVYKKKGMS